MKIIKSCQRGWTLVELLVVLAIVAIIGSGIAILGGGGFVAFHFLAKYW